MSETDGSPPKAKPEIAPEAVGFLVLDALEQGGVRTPESWDRIRHSQYWIVAHSAVVYTSKAGMNPEEAERYLGAVQFALLALVESGSPTIPQEVELFLGNFPFPIAS